MVVTIVWAVALYQHLQIYNRYFVGHREVLTDFQGNGVVNGAYVYESQTSPSKWYLPRELGIYEIIEYGENDFLQIKCVDSLQQEQPIFKYKDKFYQVSPLWITLGLQEPWWTWGNGPVIMGMGIILIVAWIAFVTVCMHAEAFL